MWKVEPDETRAVMMVVVPRLSCPVEVASFLSASPLDKSICPHCGKSSQGSIQTSFVLAFCMIDEVLCLQQSWIVRGLGT